MISTYVDQNNIKFWVRFSAGLNVCYYYFVIKKKRFA